MSLPGYQRKHLRGLAHPLNPLVQVGKDGVTDAVKEQVSAQLFSHELIKVRLLQPKDKKGMAAELAEATGAVLCGLIGHTVILYKANPDEPKITLPTRAPADAAADDDEADTDE